MPAVVLKSLSCLQHSVLLLLLQHNHFPCSSKRSPGALLLPLALRSTRIVFFLLIEQQSSKLETQVDIILTLLIKLIGGVTEADEPRPGWIRVMEIITRG